MRKKFNRLKLVLVEKEKSNKWLAEKLKKSETTVSNWCTNSRQPSIETLISIAEVLDVEVDKLLITKNN
ncbi:helix-turn-helix transcriptional regulator [Muricauda ruestringensis]|uniref:Helix-turn-helix transcriptional regulator n=1 Tax=Flagellimonas aurea TaxID=2915619 RepID=A0ABS3G9X0_9FLAO|nr:helix-turn-helix transcriptional regulator [Allomuricauda aurea]MBO0356219.1 helix-turn-helix transcriptional regulator [Allomuricauda aurea]